MKHYQNRTMAKSVQYYHIKNLTFFGSIAMMKSNKKKTAQRPKLNRIWKIRFGSFSTKRLASGQIKFITKYMVKN